MQPSLQTPDMIPAEEDVCAKVAELGPWFHNLTLRGISTAPNHFLGDYPRVKWQEFRDAVPRDLTGMTVLDIGCNAGFYSFEMESRGAERVVGIDWDEHYLEQARFAAKVLGSRVSFEQLSVWQVAELQEKFDLVLFMGVLYHLRHPLLALDLIHEHVAKDLLLFQSMQRGSKSVTELAPDYTFQQTEMFDEASYPKLHFVEHSYAADHTNWWIPNKACAEAMLRSAGFAIESNPEQEVYLCRRQAVTSLRFPRTVYPSR